MCSKNKIQFFYYCLFHYLLSTKIPRTFLFLFICLDMWFSSFAKNNKEPKEVLFIITINYLSLPRTPRTFLFLFILINYVVFIFLLKQQKIQNVLHLCLFYVFLVCTKRKILIPSPLFNYMFYS